jgi:hypothetical protein
MADVGSLIAGHPFIVIACIVLVCATGAFFFRDVVIRTKDGHSVHFSKHARQSECEMLPAMTGRWCDTFDIGGERHVAVLEITYGPEGYSIEGQEFDSKLTPVNTWESIAAERHKSRLEYFFHAHPSAHCRRNDIRGMTSLLFHTRQDNMFTGYSGTYVSVWREGDSPHTEQSDLSGRKLRQAEVDLYPSRGSVAKYYYEHMRGEASTRKNAAGDNR